MSDGGVSTPTESRFLRPAGVRAVRTDRDDLVDRVLDQPELGSGARVAGGDDRADDDDHHDVVVAPLLRLVPDGARRLVRCVHGLRLRRAARVRVRQRVRSPREKDRVGAHGPDVDHAGNCVVCLYY